MAALGPRLCTRALSSRSKRRPLPIAARGPPTIAASPAAEHRLQTRRPKQLWLTDPAAPWHAESSQTRARTHVPRTSRQTPNHCATREAPVLLFKVFFFFFWRCHTSCGILVPRPGIKPASTAVETQNLNLWTTREVPATHILLNWLFLGEKVGPVVSMSWRMQNVFMKIVFTEIKYCVFGKQMATENKLGIKITTK